MKSVRRKSAFLIAALALVLGFLVGEMVPLALFDNINLRATMMQPAGLHHRRGF